MNDTDVNNHINYLNEMYIRVAHSLLKLKRNHNLSYTHKKAKPKKVLESGFQKNITSSSFVLK